ncbi:MAG: hypothetical protein R3B65_02275 [Candidatus Paceibacterota bacterium]
MITGRAFSPAKGCERVTSCKKFIVSFGPEPATQEPALVLFCADKTASTRLQFASTLIIAAETKE